MREELIKLNFGCGKQNTEGYINVGLYNSPDICCVLVSFPWTWSDDLVIEVFIHHFIEHVTDWKKIFLEIHRMLKSNSVAHFHGPHFRNPHGIWRLHRWPFSVHADKILGRKTPYHLGGWHLFKEDKNQFNTSGNFSGSIRALSNLCPIFCDWAGFPLGQIKFVGRKETD